MNATQGMRRWFLALAAVVMCVFAASLVFAGSNKAIAATGKCQASQVRAIATYYKAVFVGWAKSASTGANDGPAKTAARGKLQTAWGKAVAGASKAGANLTNPTLDSVMLVLDPTDNSLGNGMAGGLALPDKNAGQLGAALSKSCSGAFGKLVTAYANATKPNQGGKLDANLAKIRAGLVKSWGAALTKAESNGVTYTGWTETEAMNALDQLVRDMFRTVATGPIHIDLSGLADGATTNVGSLHMTGTVVNPTTDLTTTSFCGRIVANVNGVDIPGGVSARGAKAAGPSEAVKQARAQAKREGRDPGPLAPAVLPALDAANPTEWGFDIVIPMDFGSNTIQIRLYDLDAHLLAASQSWTVFSTTPPADLLATLTWDTDGTDVDFHSSSKALDGSYDYGYYHTWYGGHTSGFDDNMTLDFDNTYGYGPEHITVGKGNPAGESIFLKVYYYSDHQPPENFIPTTAHVNVKVHGQSVFDGDFGLGAESTDSAWGSGAHIEDVGAFDLDPTDQYLVTIGQIDTSSFPQVTLHVNVQGRDSTGVLTGVDGLTAANFFAINCNYFMTLSSATGSAGDYQLTYTDKTAGKRPVFVAVTKDEGNGVIRSGTSDVTTYGKSYALLVGINDYQTINDLNYCVPDVDGMKAALQATQMFSGTDTQVTELTDNAASKAAVIAAIGSVSAVMNPEDLFVFHDSGHGGDGATENTQILCMWDSNNANYSGDISVTELQTALDACAYSGVTNVYVFLDACFSGNFIGQRAAAKAGNKVRCYLKPGQMPRTAAQPYATTFARNLSSRASYFVMAAARGTESSWDVGALNHGLFTNYLLEAIGGSDGTTLGPANSNGDVMTTCEEAFAYLQPLVVQYSTANLPAVQTPRSYDDDTANPARLKFIWQ